MKTQEQIQVQISGLKSEMDTIPSWSMARESIKAQIAVLEGKHTASFYYVDETAEEFTDGDNDVYFDAEQAELWLKGQRSENLFSEA